VRGVEAQGVQHVVDEADGVFAELLSPESLWIAEAASGSVDQVGADAGCPTWEHQVGEGRRVGAVQVDNRWAGTGLRHVDASP
jgi:hypothetical protein